MFGSTVQELAQILIKATPTKNEIEGKDAPTYFDEEKPEHELWYLDERGWERANYGPANFSA